MFASKKSRIAALASAVTAVGVSAIAATMVLGGGTGGAHAATSSTTYTGTSMTVSRTSTSAVMPKGVQPNLAAIYCSNDTDINYTGSCDAGGNDGSAGPVRHKPAPNTSFNGKHGNITSASANTQGTQVNHGVQVTTNINGLSDTDSHAANGFHVTPPDQALCVGNAGALEKAGLPLGVSPNTSVVVEGVNEAWAVYSTSGQELYGPDSLVNLFGDPYASGDILCHYDPATQSFYLGEIGVMLSGPDAYNYGTDLVVISPSAGYTSYQIDTSENANCFPDFPQQGFDNNAYYLTINEFCGANEDFAGAGVYVFPKAQLVAGATTLTGAMFGNLAPNNTPVLSLQPAFGNGTDTEYLVNANVYDAAGNGVDSSNSLGFWSITGDKNLASGGTLTLNGTSISSETYGFPVDAQSTGDGSTPAGARPYVIKEKVLTPDDSRLGQVQFTQGSHGMQLFTSLDTALTVGNDPTVVDGAAWFVIDPAAQQVTDQGYVGAAGTYLLYPTVARGTKGIVMDFSLTSPTLNPSAGYAYSQGNGTAHFGAIGITGEGSAPHNSYSDVLYARPRWGDYSVAAVDPNSGDVWSADEYIPPANQGGADKVDNWGTRVWDVSDIGR